MRFSYLLMITAGLGAIAAAPAFAQAPEEEELLGGPNAPITLRTKQPTPLASPLAAKPTPAPAPKAAPKPPQAAKAVAAPKPAPRVASVPNPPAKPAPRVASVPKPPAKPIPAPTARAPEIATEKRPTPTADLSPPPREEPPPVFAEPAEPPALEPPQEYAAPVPDRYFAQIDGMIERAARYGDISPRAANAFTDELVEIADLQDDMLRDGDFSVAQRDALEQRLSALRDNIYAASQGQRVWGGRR